MYWIYVALFLMAVAAPEAIRDGFAGIPEEEAETVFIFVFGAAGFFLTFAKEKSLLRHIREKISLQREKSDITRDLSESYSYIGAANRKLDVVSDFIFSLPKVMDAFRQGKSDRAYRAFSKTVLLFCRTDSFLLRVVDTEKREIVKEARSGKHPSYQLFDAERLLASDQAMCEDEGCLIVRSPGSVGKAVAFLAFPKVVNDVEDRRMFEVLVTEGLLLSAFEREYAPERS